ncbi:hypothetical protein PHYBLDRAFT_147065 [Phycomyces blakesleeanus NRRL 1555(-)]|uniref:Uncharacterized protein n=1 Tax=Phycomyces blakesleeanus (strain ATCC 8743b / DSM 1359 / FGSC 10004 / NBRC 33097 / NRRL 1555) TaxID=763407 RepID=A0A167M840_PHYB8|nr:hypothetical protein PHYBLDRAFT_147065 [Phycomyces blakesleeanus NRRL 1555(-)]OAD72084.1 hypothetical protein PHYBLDRAFT_147065 [Phycomyces blakesleeanus NRRL 1555(-)]|eukprot:XP_018290124.1 hypothetical protein PHYBLDRAFT_147065 [Phycomyces blakesleeanus NRRL 1555(-)]
MHDQTLSLKEDTELTFSTSTTRIHWLVSLTQWALTKRFANFTLKKNSVHKISKTECNLSFKKITIHPVARNNPTKITDRLVWGTFAILETPFTRVVLDTILGAVLAKFVVLMEVRKPQENWSKSINIAFSNRKRKTADGTKKPTRKGTVTGHYLNFLEKTMD